MGIGHWALGIEQWWASGIGGHRALGVTSSPSFLSMAKVDSKASMSSCSPSVSSTSKQMPAKPASLMSAMSLLPLVRPARLSTFHMVPPPPRESSCLPRHMPALTENCFFGSLAKSVFVMRHERQLSAYCFSTASLASVLLLPAPVKKSIWPLQKPLWVSSQGIVVAPTPWSAPWTLMSPENCTPRVEPFVPLDGFAVQPHA